MNTITVIGRIVADAEIRYTPNSDAILQFRLADDVGFGDKKTTNWWQCSLFGKRGESLKDYTKKGQQVVVTGQAQMREWNDKDGQKRLSPEIRVAEIVLTGGKQDGQSSGRNEYAAAKGAPARQNSSYEDSDIPF